jgi:Cu-Zn family superoxide dismutase
MRSIERAALTASTLLLLCVPLAAQQARAFLINPEADTVGLVRFSQTDSGVTIALDIRALPPGEHALHIHEAGTCTSPDFTSAGGHYNPTNAQHGFLSPKGPHAGDLPNFFVGPGGTTRYRITTQLVTLEKGKKTTLFPKGGTAVVIHQMPDDYRTDPAGGGGPRIACGAIEETGAEKKPKKGAQKAK